MSTHYTVTAVSYSLGDAIDWKRHFIVFCHLFSSISYSLGDAIDWKQKLNQNFSIFVCKVSYSLGDAIDWKRYCTDLGDRVSTVLLLARGRDWLETIYIPINQRVNNVLLLARGRDWLETWYMARSFFRRSPFSYSLGDAIDWKPHYEIPI